MGWRFGFGVICGLLAFSGELRAQCNDIANLRPTHRNTVRPFRVNSQSFVSLFPNLTAHQVTTAAIQAADAWNEQATGAYFRYEGDTALTALNATATACTQASQQYSIVVARNENNAAQAVTYGRCQASGSGDATYTHHEIVFYARRPGGTPYTFLTGQLTTSGFDLVSVMQHELGHMLGLAHPQNEVGPPYATMATWPNPDNDGPDPGERRIVRRDLYQYDIECAAECASGRCNDGVYGSRNVTGYSIALGPGPINFAETAVISGITDLALGRTYTAFLGYWSAAFKTALNFRFDNDSIGTNSVQVSPALLLSPFNRWDITPTVGTLLDTPHTERIFASSYLDSIPWYSIPPNERVHAVKVAWSTTGFSTSTGGPLLDYYSEGSSEIYAAKPIALAWAPNLSKPIIGWVHQTRGGQSVFDTNLVRVSAGIVYNDNLSSSASTGIKSAVGPGIACGTGAGSTVLGSYVCLVAYVDLVDSTAQVRVKGFTPTLLDTQTSVTVSSSYVATGLSTGSRIAAWFMNGKYYVAVKSAESMQPLVIHSSSNGGSTWQLEGIGPSIITGPTVSSYLTGTENRLGYIR